MSDLADSTAQFMHIYQISSETERAIIIKCKLSPCLRSQRTASSNSYYTWTFTCVEQADCIYTVHHMLFGSLFLCMSVYKILSKHDNYLRM